MEFGCQGKTLRIVVDRCYDVLKSYKYVVIIS
jgi:hypothetical protein